MNCNVRQIIAGTMGATLMAAVGTVVILPDSIAQERMPPPEQPPAEPQETVTDEELTKAANAYLAVSDIQQELHQELAGVEDEEQIQQRVEQARPKMIEAISEAGLTAADYERIINAINRDDALRFAFVEKLEEIRPPAEAVPTEPEIDPADISDQDIASAAQVYLAVSRLNQQLQEELQGVEDQALVQERVAEAEQEMLQIVDDAGLEVEEYGQIMQAVQHDQELMQQFMQHIE